jgi:hypothetical protein
MMIMRLFTVASHNRGRAEEKGRVYTKTIALGRTAICRDTGARQSVLFIGYVPLEQMVSNLAVSWAGSLHSIDHGARANGVGQALNTNTCTLDAPFSV